MIRVCVRISARDLVRFETASGLDGISIWGDDADTRTIRMPQGTSLEDAQRRADNTLVRHRGIVCSASGVSIRVPREDFEESCGVILGENEANRLATGTWEMTNIPLAWGMDALQSALTNFGWEATIERPSSKTVQGCRSWTLRSNIAPPQENMPVA